MRDTIDVKLSVARSRRTETMSAWAQEVAQTSTAEFCDLRDMAEIPRVFLRSLIAGIFGATLGYERERTGKAAGVRT